MNEILAFKKLFHIFFKEQTKAGVVPPTPAIINPSSSLSFGHHQSNSSHSSSQKKEVILAQVSLLMAIVFITCHSFKWIPNVYELLQVKL